MTATSILILTLLQKSKTKCRSLLKSANNETKIMCENRDRDRHCYSMHQFILMLNNDCTLFKLSRLTLFYFITVFSFVAAGAYVTLSVKPPGGDLYPPTPTMPSVGFLGGNGGRPHHHLSTDRVTAPLPVNVSCLKSLTITKNKVLLGFLHTTWVLCPCPSDYHNQIHISAHSSVRIDLASANTTAKYSSQFVLHLTLKPF